MLRKLKPYFPYFFLILFSIGVFITLFFPSIRMIITPEGLLSDSAKFHYPLRYFYQNKILTNQMPLWSKDMSFGFPVLAQSEVGVFNWLNFITLRFLPFSLAINIQFVVIFILLSIFSYVFAKTLRLSTLASLFFAVIFSYSSQILFNLDYFSPLNTLVYFPLVFALVIKIEEKIDHKYIIGLIVALALQVVSGHYQVFFITGFAVMSFLVIKAFINKSSIKPIFIVSLCYISAFCLAAIQLVPSLEFLNQSIRSNGLFGVEKSYVPINIIGTLIYPFILGDPQKTIAFLNRVPEYVNFFVGYIPLAIGVFFVLYWFRNRKIKIVNSNIKSLFILAIIALLLGFGDNSPLYFVFNIPPFSFFRFSSRFFIIPIFVLCYFLSIAFEFLLRRKILPKLLVFVFLLAIFAEKAFLFNYFYKTVPDKLYLNAQSDFSNTKRVYTTSSVFLYYKINVALAQAPFSLLNTLVSLEMLQKTLNPNYNLYSHSASFGYESGIRLSRSEVLDKIIADMSGINEKSGEASMSAPVVNILRNSGVDTITSVIPYDSSAKNWLTLEKKTPSQYQNGLIYYIYKINNPKRRVQFYNKVKIIETVDDFRLHIKDSVDDTVLMEKDFPEKELKKLTSIVDPSNSHFEYTVNKDADTELSLSVKTDRDGILVVADRYYPGWHAYVDHREVNIYKANLIERAISLEKGSHKIEFVYRPQSLIIGEIITVTSFLILVVITIFLNGSTRFF